MSADPHQVQATFEGESLTAPAGASIAAALIASGRIKWRSTRDGAQRGLFCGIGVCFDCLVEVDGESGQRACMIPLKEGMRVCAAKGPQAEGGPAAAEVGQSAAEVGQSAVTSAWEHQPIEPHPLEPHASDGRTAK